MINHCPGDGSAVTDMGPEGRGEKREMEDDFIIEALRVMVQEIYLKRLLPDTGEMARLIDKKACQLTAYMAGLGERFART